MGVGCQLVLNVGNLAQRDWLGGARSQVGLEENDDMLGVFMFLECLDEECVSVATGV